MQTTRKEEYQLCWPDATALASPCCPGCCPGAGAGGGGGGGGGDDKSITVLMVGNPQMVDIQKLTKDNFTKQTGIKVKLHGAAGERAARQGHPGRRHQGRPVRRGHHRRLRGADLGEERLARTTCRPYADKDAVVRQGATCSSRWCKSLSGEDGKLYGVPFYGESSFLMYRKDMFEGEGPDHARTSRPGPQVADIAAKVDGAEPA